MVKVLGVRVLSFNDKAIKRAVSATKRSVLSKGGSYIMWAARYLLRPAKRKAESEMTDDEMRDFSIRLSMWKRKGGKDSGKPRPKRPYKPSAPGQPPRVRPKSPLKRLLVYGWDPARESVVVGPRVFRKGEAPSVLEFGGRGMKYTWDIKQRKRRQIAVNVARRPFMGPALKSSLPALPPMWRNSIGPVRG